MSLTRALRFVVDGQSVEITVRPFTEAEAVAHADKEEEARRPGGKLTDFLDDGDEEVIAAVVSPTKAELLDLLEAAPGLSAQISEAIWDLSGNGFRLTERPLSTEELARLGDWGKARLLALDLHERGAAAPTASLIVRKLGRAALKVLQQHEDTRKRRRIPYGLLARAAKEQVVSGADTALWERLPPLSVALGVTLLSKTVAAQQVTEGK